jgi:hypothetical protein
VVVVKIDNIADARPPTNLTSADIVYVRAAYRQRSRTSLAPPSRQAANPPCPLAVTPKGLQPVSAKTAATTDIALLTTQAAHPCRPGGAGAARRGQLPGCSRRVREWADPADTGVAADRVAAGARPPASDPLTCGPFGLLLLAGRPGFLLARYEVGGSRQCGRTAGAASSM